MTALLLGRVVPLLTAKRARYIVERNLLVYRRLWLIIVSGFFEPLFYLFSIGVGLGALIGDVTGPDGQPMSYAAFVAPALLASSAMNGAIYESTNVFFKLKYEKTYVAVLATPVGPSDIALGEIIWSLIRGMLYTAGFLVVTIVAGLMPSAWGLLALPAATVIGFGFASLGVAAVTYMRTWQDFDLIQLVLIPLFLFSATFYPLDVYPPAIQTLTHFSPLYHGVELIRSLNVGHFEISMLGNAAVLIALGIFGALLAAHRVEKLLVV